MGEVGRLKTQFKLQFKSQGSLLVNQEEPELPMKSEGSLLKEFTPAQGSWSFILFGPSVDRMRPTRRYGGQSAFLKVH